MSPSESRKRLMKSGPEALFFAVTLVIAVVFQLTVFLKVANVIAW